MSIAHPVRGELRVLRKSELATLLRLLREDGYETVAPVHRDAVLSLQPVTDVDQIARGLVDEHRAGHYRLHDDDADAYFDNVVGPDSAKRFFFPAESRLFALHVENDRFVLDEGQAEPPRRAILGLRPCDLAAIRIQDRVFGIDDEEETFRCESETYYRLARERSLLIAVNCTRPGGTCFCASWDTGPEAKGGFDLALTELRTGFLVEAGSERGQDLLLRLHTESPTGAELELAQLKLERAREHMGRKLHTEGLPAMLDRNVQNPRWSEIGETCLGCGNCTMVCPTCFCSTVTDSNDLATGSVIRTRRWESCFTHQFSYVTSGPARSSIRARYRHWLRHKLGTWWEQFGSSGCVGCGRCLTWCPVGIDWPEHIAQMQQTGIEARPELAEVRP
jgi:ferredoxin